MGGCFSKCGGKYMVGHKEKGTGGGDTPQLVNKLDKNASFTNGGTNGTKGTTKARQGSSSSSEDGKKAVEQMAQEPASDLQPNVVTSSSMSSTSQVTSKSETLTSEDGAHTTTVNEERSQTHVTSATQKVITSTQVVTDPAEVEALLAAGGQMTSSLQESSRISLQSSQVTSEVRVLKGSELGEAEPRHTAEVSTSEVLAPNSYRTETFEVTSTPDSHTEVVKTVVVTQESSQGPVEPAWEAPPGAPPAQDDLEALGVVEMSAQRRSSSSSSEDDDEIPPPPPEVPTTTHHEVVVPVVEVSTVFETDLPTPPPGILVDEAEVEANAEDGHRPSSSSSSSSSDHAAQH